MSELTYKGYDLTVNTNVRKGLVGRVLWSHPDYDGAIDSHDIRCGGSSSVEDAIEEIDEVIRELDARKSSGN